MGGLEAVLQTVIKTTRKLPPNIPVVSEDAEMELHSSGYQFIGSISKLNSICRTSWKALDGACEIHRSCCSWRH